MEMTVALARVAAVVSALSIALGSFRNCGAQL